MVELEFPNRSRLVAACTYPCEEGLVVQTHSEKVIRSRRMTMELILASSYNNPQMLELAKELGVEQVRFKLPEESDCVLCGLMRARLPGDRWGERHQRHPTRHREKSGRAVPGHLLALYRLRDLRLICPTGAFDLSSVTGYRQVTP
jgi:hypothetical protein